MENKETIIGDNPAEQIKLCTTFDGVFLNSRSIFIEYLDIIKSPYYMMLLLFARHRELLPDVFDQTPLMNFTDDSEESIMALTDWYYDRKNQNFLYDLLKPDAISGTSFNDIDGFLNAGLHDCQDLLDTCEPLNIVEVINSLVYKDSLLVPSIYIYYPYPNEWIERDTLSLFDNKEGFHFITGDIMEVLKDIPQDSTYIFSDITNIECLIELDKLNYSSILCAIDYQYSRGDGDNDWVLDIEELMEKFIFKFNPFIATPLIHENDILSDLE